MVKTGCFSFENSILMGGKLDRKFGIGKVKFSRSNRHIHVYHINVRTPLPIQGDTFILTAEDGARTLFLTARGGRKSLTQFALTDFQLK